MDWLPTISDRRGPVYQRIADALADDMLAGVLRQGQPLPTHRALAQALGIDLTTVTRAYAEARRRGLIEATVGRGTFVGKLPPPTSRTSITPSIDLSMNLPPQPAEADLDGRIARTLAELRAEVGFGAYLTYQHAGGSAAERAIAAEWLKPIVPDVTSERLLIAPGTQATLMGLLTLLAKPGDSILVESLTYPGFKAAATQAGVRLVGVEMDHEGIDPDALSRACRTHKASLVYLTPTQHNPTTATMSSERRQQVADVIREHNLTLIEDDPHIFLVPGLAPLATFIPERTYLTASFAKCIAPGLRASLLVAPDRGAAGRVAAVIRAVTQMAAPLMTAIVVRWMRDGTARKIIEAIVAEAQARQALAREVLAGHEFAAHPNAHHIWLPLADVWSSTQFGLQAQRRGVAVVTSDAFATRHPAPDFVRVALGAARTRADLTRALEILRDALASHPPVEQVV
jgi:DNA-binding transcriptional MocR family regulator